MKATVQHEFRKLYAGVHIPDNAADVEYAQAFSNVEVLLHVFADLGHEVKKDDNILDFGSGAGRMVYAFRKLGYRAFGTDIVSPSAEVEQIMEQEQLCGLGERPLTTIQIEDYKMPFEDDYFDYVVSWDVMEHVQDHDRALSEIRRVLKPCGRSLHFFPACYRFLEAHVHVPLGTLFQRYGYLYFWALMGLRTRSQKGLTAREVAQRNHEFLTRETKYLTKKHLVQLVGNYFEDTDFVEDYFWKHHGGKTGLIYKVLLGLGLAKLTPFVAHLLSPFAHRALFFSKPRNKLGPKVACRDSGRRLELAHLTSDIVIRPRLSHHLPEEPSGVLGHHEPRAYFSIC